MGQARGGGFIWRMMEIIFVNPTEQEHGPLPKFFAKLSKLSVKQGYLPGAKFEKIATDKGEGEAYISYKTTRLWTSKVLGYVGIF